MGTAAGLATTGKIVFASTFAVFATGRSYDQVRNTIAHTQTQREDMRHPWRASR